MKTILLSTIVFLTTLSTTACASRSQRSGGSLIREERAVARYDKIAVSRGVSLIVSDDVRNVVVQAREDMIDHVITRVKGDELQVSVDLEVLVSVRNVNISGIKVYVPSSRYRSLSASSGANISMPGGYEAGDLVCESNSGSAIHFPDGLTAESVAIHASSGSTVSGGVECGRISVKAGSGSSVKLSGTTEYMEAEASSGSSVSCFELKAVTAAGKAGSGSSVRLYASKEVSGSASSGASVIYDGGAATVSGHTSSGGSFRAR